MCIIDIDGALCYLFAALTNATARGARWKQLSAFLNANFY